MTLIKPLYTYEKINRTTIDGQRRYLTPGGGAVASVTTILGATKDQSHLEEWRRRVGHQKAQDITTEAAGVGTRMHKYLETYVETAEWPSCGNNPYAQQAHKMAGRIKDEALVDVAAIWGSEVALYVPQLYAGTTDLVGVYKGNDAIMDFKQTNKVKKGEWVEDYFLQLTAYAIAHNEIHKTNIQHGHIFMCSRDLIYQQFDLTPDPDPYFNRTFNEWADIWWARVYEFYDKNR